LINQVQIFEMSKKEKADWNKKVLQLTEESKKLETEIEEIKANKIFENAFEWRFEFPEVLNDDGDFVGFDVVIGNPPYGVSIKDKTERDYLISNLLKVPDFEIYYWFINKAKHNLVQCICTIISNEFI
jgi:methylase of polypeptide subunit release factors